MRKSLTTDNSVGNPETYAVISFAWWMTANVDGVSNTHSYLASKYIDTNVALLNRTLTRVPDMSLMIESSI